MSLTSCPFNNGQEARLRSVYIKIYTTFCTGCVSCRVITFSTKICNVKQQDTATIRSIELLAQLGTEDLDLILKERTLRWYGHVERSNGAVKPAFDIQVNGKRGPERPKMTWKQLTERDRREWKLSAIDLHDRDTWRSGVKSAMRAASQLPGRGPTVVDMALIPAR